MGSYKTWIAGPALSTDPSILLFTHEKVSNVFLIMSSLPYSTSVYLVLAFCRMEGPLNVIKYRAWFYISKIILTRILERMLLKRCIFNFN
jgi:hypothetical protein